MAKLPTLKKILREDVKAAPAWISAVIEPFNSLAEFMYQSLNGSLTFQDNIACFIKEVSVKTPSTYPVMDNFQFMNELKTKAIGVQVLQVVEKTTYLPVASSVAWVENNGFIVVSAVTGLTAGKNYSVRLLVS